MTTSSSTQRASRRGLAAASALSVAVAGGAVALAGSTSAAAPASLKYTCTLKNFNTKYRAPWAVKLNAKMPASVRVGAKVPAPGVTATVVTGSDASAQLKALKVKTVGGTASAAYSVGSAGSNAALKIGTTKVPGAGNLTTTASGTGKAFVAPKSPQTLPVKAGAFTSDLTTDTGFVIHLSCSPVAGSNTTIGSIKVTK